MNSGLYDRAEPRPPPAGGVGELVGRADDERVERVARVQPRWPDRRAFGRHDGKLHIGRAGRRLRSWRGEDAIDRRLLGVGFGLGHERQGGIGATYLSQRVGQHARVVLQQPVPENGVGNPDRHPLTVVRDELGAAKPRRETVPVDLGFDPGENLIPDRHFSPPSAERSDGPKCMEIRHFRLV